jgi:hypothetical protein
MARCSLARLPLVDRPPKVPIGRLDRRDRVLLAVGVGLSVIVGFTIAVAVLYVLGFVGIIDAQATSTGDFALILWIVSTYLLGLATTDRARERAIQRGQDNANTDERRS